MKSLEVTWSRILAPDSRQFVRLFIVTLAFLATGVEVFQNFGALPIGSDESQTGPFVDLVAYVSFVYFAALVAGMISNLGHGISIPLLTVIRIGAASSVLYLVALFFSGSLTVVSLIAHGCNLLFWLESERSPRSASNNSRVLRTTCSAVAISTVVLYVAATESARLQREQTEREQYEKSVSQQTPKSKTTTTGSQTLKKTSTIPFLLNNSRTATAKSEKLHLKGPANAKARFVVYYDYENRTSGQVDRALRELLARYPDTISLAARHYPASANNNTPLESSARSDACDLNLMAETAGMLKGEEGFWQMHQWLVDCDTEIGERERREAIAAIGIQESAVFEAAMLEPSRLARIISDIVDARSQGIQSAPAVLLNGKRLNDLNVAALEQAVQSTVESVAGKSTNKDSLASKAIDSAALDSFPREQQQAYALATVRILNPGAKATGSGTVFATQGGFAYALSAWHLVTTAKTVEVQTFAAQSYPEPEKIHSWAAVVAASETFDLAIIRFPDRGNGPQPIPLIPSTKLAAMDAFEALTTGCDGMLSPPTCEANRVIAARNLRRNNSGKAALMWETQKLSAQGRSGGALLDPNGFIIGIASGNSDGKGFFCHAQEIHQLLRDNGLSKLLEGK